MSPEAEAKPQKEKQKTIKIAVEANALIPYEKLEPFQEEIKRLEKDQYEQLKNSIVEDGFSFSIHVWKNKGKNWIIDGHQRLFTVKHMAEVEGFKIPALPVSFVKADSFVAAKRKVLAGASQYGKINEHELYNYITKNDIPFDRIVANYYFPEVDWGEFSAKFLDNVEIPGVNGPTDNDGSTPDMKSGSDTVKQIQLFFNSTSHQEFMEKVDVLAKHYKTENITDTVMEIVRADYQVKSAISK